MNGCVRSWSIASTWEMGRGGIRQDRARRQLFFQPLLRRDPRRSPLDPRRRSCREPGSPTYVAGMTDRFCIRTFLGSERPGRRSRRDKYTAVLARSRPVDVVDMPGAVGARTELRRSGVNSYFGLCPFH